MIQLFVEDYEFDLPPNLEITLVNNCNIFNLEQLEGVVTYPFPIPRNPKNDQFFKNLHHHQTNQKFKTYENARLCFSGVVLAQGKLKINISQKNFYETTFLANASKLVEFKEKNINELFTAADTTESRFQNVKFPDLVQADKVTFPTVYIGEILANNDWELSDNFYAAPQLNFKFSLEKIFEKLGYSFAINIPDFIADLEKIILFNNKEPNLELENLNVGVTVGVYGVSSPDLRPNYIYKVPEFLKIGDMLPQIGLAKFVANIRKLLCVYFDFDKFTNSVEMVLMRDIILNALIIEWTSKAENVYSKEDIKKEGIRYAFKLDDDNFWEENPDKLIGDYVGDVFRPDSLPISATPESLYLVKKTNFFYKFAHFPVNSLGISEFNINHNFAYPSQDLAVGTEDLLIETEFCPTLKTTKIWKKFPFVIKLKKWVVSGYNFTICAYGTARELLPMRKVRILNSKNISKDIVYDIIEDSISVGGFWFNAIWSSEEDEETDIEFEYEYDFLAFLPKIDIKPHRPRLAEVNDKNYLRLLFDFGVRQKFDGTSYRFASADAVSIKDEVLSTFSLRWHGDDGLRNMFWHEYEEIMLNAEQTKMRIRLNINDLLNFKPTTKVRIKDQNYFVTKITTKISHSGIQPSEVELLRAVYGDKEAPDGGRIEDCQKTFELIIKKCCEKEFEFVIKNCCTLDFSIIEVSEQPPVIIWT